MKWINARDLEDWANSILARTTFPGLIYDLINASTENISSIRFPNREKGQVRGVDGFLTAAGAPPFVPEGTSIWEFGVSGDVILKANNDFNKRTTEISPDERKNYTFVFATPRTWDRPDLKISDWIEEKKALNRWKDVKFFDGVQLEHWLDKHPAVASYYARYELCNAPNSGAYSLREYWDEFSSRFDPPLTEEVVLAGRHEQADEIVRRLMDGDRRLEYSADSPDEVIAFVVASIRKADQLSREYLEARAIIVEKIDAARMLTPKKGLIFLPRGDASLIVGSLMNSGPTVVSASACLPRGRHKELARPTLTELAKAFVSMGICERDGYDLARRCGRSLAVLARQIPSGTAQTPEWLGNSEVLIPALLAGKWKSSSIADEDVLRILGGRDKYEEVEAPLRTLTALSDSPIERVGDVWAMRSSVDAFLYLGKLIGREHLNRFESQAIAVFSRINEPPKAEDVFSLRKETSDSHSRWLRDGMMTTLLHMAALHEKAGFVVSGSTPQQFVNSIVRSLPNLSSDHRLLESLRDQLPLLAEAAPIPFLEALECLLEGDGGKIKSIFSEQDDYFAPTSPHPNFLWALEVLAWNEEYLLRVAICLAKLASIDPGGRLANRPINSLRAIFLPWSPHTNAKLARRLGVLRSVLRTVPSIAWSLLTRLLPKSGDVVSPTQKPKFAEAAPGGGEVITFGIVWATEKAVLELSVECAELMPERWHTLIRTFGQLQPGTFDIVVSGLEDCLSKQDADARNATWDLLRKEVNRHRAFKDVDWSLKGDGLRRLEALVTKFQPNDPLIAAAWLFDDYFPDVEARRIGNPMASIHAARVAALREIIQTCGVSRLAELASKVKLPYEMAEPLIQINLGEDDYLLLMSHLLKINGNAKGLANILFAQGLKSYGISWIERIRSLLCELQLPEGEIAQLFFSLEDSRSSWDIISSFGFEVDLQYWQNKGPFGFRGTAEDLQYLISRYLACGRVLAAIEASSQQLADVDTQTMFNLLESAIPEINASPNSGARSKYYIERYFDELNKRPEVTQEKLAYLEFAYWPFFQSNERSLALHKILVQSPEFFVSVVSVVYTSDDGAEATLTEHEQKLATAAYQLLNSLHVLPGVVGEDIDYSVLKEWVDEVRQRANGKGLGDVTDSRIGRLLAHAPTDPVDQAWPHKSVRELIEYLESEEVERAVCIERFNMRGVFSKTIGEGGKQERLLADRSTAWADAMPDYPRTVAMLLSMAQKWKSEGEQEDLRAEKEQLY